MKPSLRNLFMKKLTRDRVAPIISASVSWLILTPMGCELASLPKFRCSFLNRRRRLSPIYSVHCLTWNTLPISPALLAGLFGRPFAVDADKAAVSPRRLGKREEASLEEFA